MKIIDDIIMKIGVGFLKKKLKENKTMAAIIELLKGKKTYVVGFLAIVLGILQGFDIWSVPAEYWPIIGALGLGALKAGTERNAKEIKGQIKEKEQ